MKKRIVVAGFLILSLSGCLNPFIPPKRSDYPNDEAFQKDLEKWYRIWGTKDDIGYAIVCGNKKIKAE